MISAPTLEEWNKYWQEFAEPPGTIWGRGGEFFTLPPEDAAKKVITILQQTPKEIFTNKAPKGIDTLLSLAQRINDNKALPQNNVGKIFNLITEKLVDVTKATQFSGEEPPQRIGSWDYIYRKIGESVLPKSSKDTIQNLIIERARDMIFKQNFGELNPAFKELAGGPIWQAIHSLTDERLKEPLIKALSEKMIDIFKSKAFSGTQALVQFAKQLENKVEKDLKDTAWQVIADKTSEYLRTLASENNPKQAVTDILWQYQLLKKLNFPEEQREQVNKAFLKHVGDLIERMPSNAESIDALLEIVTQAKRDRDFLVIEVIAERMNNIILDTLENHTIMAESVAEKGTPEEIYINAYKKEIGMLTSYLSVTFDTAYKISENAKAGQLAAAKRLTRLQDFMNAQEKLAAAEKQGLAGWAFSKIKGVLGDAFKAFKGENTLVELINTQDPDFAKTQHIQKELFAKGRLEALPEDMLARLNAEIHQTMSQVSAAKDKKEFLTLFNKLLELQKRLEEPLIAGTRYGFKDLLIEKADEARFAKLSQKLPAQMIKAFDENLSKIIPGEELGSAGTERTAKLAELDAMRKRLLSDPAFKSASGSAELLQKIIKIVDVARSRDRADMAHLEGEVEKIIQDAVSKPLEEMGSLKDRTESAIKELETLGSHSLGLSAAATNVLYDRLQEAQAWSGIIDIADSYTALRAEGSTADVAQKAYNELTQKVPEIVHSLDYRNKPDTDRATFMTKQERALRKVSDLLNQKVGSYTMVDLGIAMDNMINALVKPKLDMIKVLEEQGYIQEKPAGSGFFEPTLKGSSLAEITRENTDIVERSQQLKEYLDKYGKTLPSLVMEIAGKPIKLAEGLKLSWMILDDQLDALKQKYLESLRDPLKDRIIDIQNSISARVDTVDKGMERLEKLLGLTAEQLQDLGVLVKALGLAPEVIANPVVLAKHFGIAEADMDNPRVIGKKFGLSEKQIEQTDPSKLSFNNKEVQIELMQSELVMQKLQEQTEKRVAPGEAKLSNTLLLGDIADILAEQRKQSGKRSVDPYFEALVGLRRKLLDMSPAEREKFNKTEALLSLRAAADGSVSLKLDPRAVTDEMKLVFVEMARLMGDGLSGFATYSHKLWIQARKGTSFIVKLAALPVAAVTYILTRIGISTAWSAGTTAATGGATAAGGPIAGLLTYIMLPGPGFLPDIVGLLAGTAAGGVLYYVGSEIKPSKEEIEKLNEELITGGFDPIKVPEGQGWVEASKEWIVNTFAKSDMGVWTATAAQQKSAIDNKVVLFEQARTEFYHLLELPPTASTVEVESAIVRKQAEIETSWGINRQLISRRFNNAYRFVLRSAQDVVEANDRYMTTLANIQTKALAAPAERAESAGIKYGWERLKGAAGALFRWMTGIKKEPKEGLTLSAGEFTQFKSQVDEFFGRQITDLRALKDFITENKDQIKSASPFNDQTYLTTFQNLLDGRIATLRDEYAEGVRALLKEYGFKTSGTIGA